MGEWRGLDDTRPSDDVFPSLAQSHLLGIGPGSLGFRSGPWDAFNAISDTLGRLH